MTLEQILLIAAGVWLTGLTIGFWWFFSKFNSLIKRSGGKSLIRTLDKVLKESEKTNKQTKELKKEVKSLDRLGRMHIQKVGLVRFNPFDETGGDHSFSLALMDGEEKGVVLTGLHTRERTRLYMKPIEKGKSTYELSKEEIMAINQARKN